MRKRKEYREWLGKQAKDNRQNMTNPEARVSGWLKEHGIRYKKQVPIYCSKDDCGYIADFVLYDPAVRKCVLEIDGIHHECGEQKMKDEIRTGRLGKKGYLVARIPNSSTTDDESLNEYMVKAICKLKMQRDEEFIRKII